MLTRLGTVALLALSACTDEPAPIAHDAPLERIGDYCVMEGCDGVDFASEGGGDDQCEAMVGAVTACCLADNICHRGIRFHGAFFELEAAPAEETCPEDANGNGICVVGDVYYSLCDA